MKKAYLSGLGVMGRRHLLGLVRGGFEVTALDPRQESADAAVAALGAAGLDAKNFHRVSEAPKGDFAVAVFSETAPYRMTNIAAFLVGARAERWLVEKPLTADPEKLGELELMFERAGVSRSSIQVNLSRRLWPLFRDLKTQCLEEKSFTVTVNGGAVGFGCNGIHHLDTFLFLAGNHSYRIPYAKLSDEHVGSGRGTEFSDFGVSFVLECGPHRLLCSLGAESSAAPVFCLRGEHLSATFDEGDLAYRVRTRKSSSVKPKYFAGHDYETTGAGTLELSPMDQLSQGWAEGKVQLPSFEDGLRAHRLMFEILEAAGAPRPYQFT